MNTIKLKTLGFNHVMKACLTHENKAEEYRRKGNWRMMRLHEELNCQCAGVAIDILSEKKENNH